MMFLRGSLRGPMVEVPVRSETSKQTIVGSKRTTSASSVAIEGGGADVQVGVAQFGEASMGLGVQGRVRTLELSVCIMLTVNL